MSLEHFKKQVLLLHSEQSALDSLSSGFNDRYTVHCATSGSEALNTLGEIQIDVIVSAQELPGMSGLDALREAKKRSPDTIGILLAGNEDDGLEALVGDQEVFQIVRGTVTPDSLKSLIDGVTRQARLMALAESANDTTANPDEPVAEHIVMETSENGSTIISDGTGRMPVLDPKKVSASADVGARSVDVLVLTHDEEFLGTVRESARGLHNVIYANTLQQADEAVRKHKVGVVVVDAAMAGANVEKLAVHLRAASPRLVAIVAGRRDDGEMLMDLINRGKVYRFLLKPVSPGRSRLAIEASVKHHLEAPDSAFLKPGATAPAPAQKPQPAAKARPEPQPKAQPKPQPKPQPKSAPKPQPKAQTSPAPAPQARKPEPSRPAVKPAKSEVSRATPRVEPEVSIVANRDEALSPIDDGMADAFGDDSSFTQTMTGIVKSVSRSFSKSSDSPAEVPDRLDSAGSGGSLFGSPKVLGIGAVAVIAVLGIGFWLYSGSDERAPAIEPSVGTPSITEAEPVFDNEPPVQLGPNVNAMLEEARLAADAGQIFNPPGGNAIELYMAAIEAAPGDATVEAEFNAIIEQALAMAESSLLDRRVDDVAAALNLVALADPENSRLPFLNAQLSQMQLRNFLDDARVSIRDSRFEDARIALDAARALAVADSSEIDTVADELSAALSEQRVDEVLAQANERLEEGKLIAPTNDNARYYYELALSNDPNNAMARQGLTTIASKLVLQARAQIDQGNLDTASDLIADARRLDPSSSEVAASASALQDARNRQEQERVAAQQRAAAERAAAERAAAERAAAERAAAEKAATERAAAEQQAAQEQRTEEQQAAQRQRAEEEQASEPPVAQPVQAVPGGASEVAATESQVVASTGADSDPGGAEDTVDSGEQAAVPTAAPRPVSVSSLNRTKYVAPKYPRSAQRRGISGWVDVVFTVDIDGSVANVTVRDSEPGDLFISAASNAVAEWEFEPVIENGVAIQKQAAVRMMFALE